MDTILFILILIIPAIAQVNVSGTYHRFKKVENEKKITGQEVARKILDKNGLNDIYVVEVTGSLTDHYDPSRKVVKLSSDVYHSSSVSSLAIAAHECGHAIQDKEGYFYMRLRSLIYPIVRIGTSLSYFIIMIGLISQALNVIYLGILLVGLGLVFQLVTLPVEFDASKRAKKELEKYNLVSEIESYDVKSVLNAAAMTYVAGVLSSALEIVRLIFAFGGNDRK